MTFAFDLLAGAAIIGLVIAFLERSAFPGWGESIGSAFGIGLCSAVTGILLPESLHLLAYVGGALGGGFLVAWLCDVSLRRGFLAAGIYLGVSLVLHLLVGAIS